MKKVLFFLCFVSSLFAKTPAKNVLVLYYSWGGNIKEIANEIHSQQGGDIIELEIENPYSNDYKKTTEQAKKEIADGYKPKLKTKIKNIKKYSLIYLGSPIWWGTISTPVASFLSEYDLTGIDIISFVSHGGGGAGRSFDDIKKSTKGNLVSQLVYSGKTAEKK